MKINAQLLLQLRLDRCWSQEELGIAAGLNTRTIQRIEKEASASLQSKKALASTFSIDISDLDYQEIPTMKQYEFKTLEIDSNEGFLTGLKKTPLPDLASLFNVQGQRGWTVVQILTPELASGVWGSKIGKMVALLQREVVGEQ